MLPYMSIDGDEVWGADPVHPRRLGYELLADLIERSLGGGGKKRMGGNLQPPNKRQRTTPRPDWVAGTSENAVRRDWANPRPFRGRGGCEAPGNFRPRGRGGWGARGGGGGGRGGGGRGGSWGGGGGRY
jgi:hypothetical protein